MRVEIEGMSCDGCVRSVQKTLGRVAGLTVGQVAVGSAHVTLDTAGEQDVRRAIEKAGFSVARITPE